jgi:hypothetical protein
MALTFSEPAQRSMRLKFLYTSIEIAGHNLASFVELSVRLLCESRFKQLLSLV